MLATLKGLRGTGLDLFGYTAERRMERRLIRDYRALIRDVVERLAQDNLATGIELARAASDIGGYGPVKDASVKAYVTRLQSLLADFAATPTQSQPRAA